MLLILIPEEQLESFSVPRRLMGEVCEQVDLTSPLLVIGLHQGSGRARRKIQMVE